MDRLNRSRIHQSLSRARSNLFRVIRTLGEKRLGEKQQPQTTAGARSGTKISPKHGAILYRTSSYQGTLDDIYFDLHTAVHVTGVHVHVHELMGDDIIRVNVNELRWSWAKSLAVFFNTCTTLFSPANT